MGRITEITAAGDEGADFAAFGIVENARAAGAVGLGAFGARGCWRYVGLGGGLVGVHGSAFPGS